LKAMNFLSAAVGRRPLRASSRAATGITMIPTAAANRHGRRGHKSRRGRTSRHGKERPKPTGRMLPDEPDSLRNVPSQTLDCPLTVAQAIRLRHLGLPAMTSRGKAEDGVAAGDAVAGDAVAADDAMTSVIALCRPVWMTSQQQIAGRLQPITTASMTVSTASQAAHQISPAKWSTVTSMDRLGRLTDITAPTRKLLPAVGDAGGVAVAAVEAVANARVISSRGRVQTPRGASSRLTAPKAVLDQVACATPMPIGNSTMSRCRPATVHVLQPGPRIRPAASGADRPLTPLQQALASLQKPQKMVIGMGAKLVVAADDDAGGEKDGRARGAARQVLQIPAERVRSPRDVRPTAAGSDVADATAAATAMTAARLRPRHSTAAGGMNSPLWQEDARRTTRASSFSASRMPAGMAMFETSGIPPRVTTTASSRADSTRCLMYRVGSKRSAS